MPLSNAKAAGTLLIVGAVQFIIVLVIAEAHYPNYNVAVNYISDLGVWGTPSAWLFNPSVILLGVLSLAAAIYIKRHYHLGKSFYLYVVAGLGAIGVGVFPENTFHIISILSLHNISAVCAFVFGGFAAFVAFKVTEAPFRYIAAALGVFVLVVFGLFLATRDSGGLSLGAGGMERLIVYPTVLGLMCFGGYLLGSEKQS